MTKTITNRLGLNRWSADADTWARSEFDANNAAREANVLIARAGSSAAIPAAGDGRRFYYATDAGVLLYDGGTGWRVVQARAEASATLASNHTGSVIAYRRKSRVAVTVALVTGTSYTNPGDVIAQIAAGFRPAVPYPTEAVTVRSDGFNGTAIVKINTNGDVTVERTGSLQPGTSVTVAVGPYPAAPIG